MIEHMLLPVALLSGLSLTTKYKSEPSLSTYIYRKRVCKRASQHGCTQALLTPTAGKGKTPVLQALQVRYKLPIAFL